MNQLLNVTLVSTERRWQGGEEQAWQLARGLQALGHCCRIVAPAGTPLARHMARHGFAVHALGGRSPWPWRIAAVRRSLRRQAVDVVHCNDAHAVTLGGLAAWRLPFAVVMAARRVGFPLRSSGKYRLLCDRLLCVSTYAAQQCTAAGIPADRVRVVPDGVDPGRVQSGDRTRGRAATGTEPGDTLLLTVGSLVSCKGHLDLIEAMPSVLRQWPRARLLIAGEGPERSRLEAQIQRLGVAQRVALLGHRDDIPDLIQACDLFVFPSTEEGFGSTLVDVMLARRPIVATRAGGIPDVVGGNEPGAGPCAWTVTPGQPAELSQAMLAALQDEPGRQQRTGRAHQRALDRFTVDVMVRATVTQYVEALQAKRRACSRNPKGTRAAP
jgi:glycosyltransferase involved in cell wall biosynthesis